MHGLSRPGRCRFECLQGAEWRSGWRRRWEGVRAEHARQQEVGTMPRRTEREQHAETLQPTSRGQAAGQSSRHRIHELGAPVRLLQVEQTCEERGGGAGCFLRVETRRRAPDKGIALSTRPHTHAHMRGHKGRGAEQTAPRHGRHPMPTPVPPAPSSAPHLSEARRWAPLGSAQAHSPAATQ